jgi:hypothetical protein
VLFVYLKIFLSCLYWQNLMEDVIYANKHIRKVSVWWTLSQGQERAALHFLLIVYAIRWTTSLCKTTGKVSIKYLTFTQKQTALTQSYKESIHYPHIAFSEIRDRWRTGSFKYQCILSDRVRTNNVLTVSAQIISHNKIIHKNINKSKLNFHMTILHVYRE